MALVMSDTGDGAELANIIACADATNHAIPTPNELSWAFTKLFSVGLLRKEEGKFRISEEFRDDLVAAYNEPGGLFETARKGENWLNESGLDLRVSKNVTVTKENVDDAYKTYISRIRK